MRFLVVFVLAFALANGKYISTDADLTAEFLNKTSECVKNIYNEGRPSVGLPSFNPLVIKHKELNLDNLGIPGISGTISIDNSVLQNLYNYYLSHIEIEEHANGFLDLELVSEWPESIDFEGTYNIDINIFGSTLQGAGKVSAAVIHLIQSLKLMALEIEVLISIEDFKFHIDEVILNGKDITDSVNGIFNRYVAEWIGANSELIGAAFSKTQIMVAKGDSHVGYPLSLFPGLDFEGLQEIVNNECSASELS